jgi:hypothetical protein
MSKTIGEIFSPSIFSIEAPPLNRNRDDVYYTLSDGNTEAYRARLVATSPTLSPDRVGDVATVYAIFAIDNHHQLDPLNHKHPRPEIEKELIRLRSENELLRSAIKLAQLEVAAHE